jgi:ribosomal protein L20
MILAKGYWGSRSKVYTVAKNTVEKGLQSLIAIEKPRKESSELYGSNVSTLVPVSTEFLTHS